jgi:quinol monooxygenase YgiN
MIVIAGTLSLDPAKREPAIAAARALMEATRKEPGCVAYVFSEELDEAGTFRIFEEWKSQQDLDAHIKAPHMKAFQQVVPTLGVRGMKLQKYEIASVGPLR